MTRSLAPVACLILALGVLLLLGAPARAQSIGVSPGSLEVEDALRGTEYFRRLVIINQRSGPETFRLGVSGEAAPWVTLYAESDRTVPIDRISAPAEGEARLVVQIQIPDDAPNRRHNAEISIQTAPAEEEGPEGGAAGIVTGGFGIDVLIDVTGTQRLEGIVSGVTVRETEVGLPLRARMLFTNTGNVQAEPEVRLTILDADANFLDSVEAKDVRVPLEASAELRAEWDTTDREPGPYGLNLAVLLGDEEIHSQSFDIQLWPAGTFTRQGELGSLELSQAAFPGAVARLIAVFHNTGEIDTLATFQGEIFRFDALVDTVTTLERLVETGQQVEFDVFVPITESGEYIVRGLVNYEGKETVEREVAFKAPPDFGEGGFLGRPWWQVAGVAILLPAVLFAGAVEARRWLRNRAQPSRRRYF